MKKFLNIDRRRFLSTAGAGIATAATLPWLDPNVALAAGGTLTVALPNNPTTFDPANQRNHDAMAMSQVVFENLYEVDVNAEPQPMLAVGHQVADDGMTWWFDLRDDVVFHNGQKMTAEDVKYSYEWILDPKNKARRRSVWTRIKNIVVESPTRVRFEMAQPYGTMLYYMTKYMGIFPKGSREKHGAAAFTSNPVGLGTGPGIFVGARKNDYVEFKRNPNYWRKGVPAWEQADRPGGSRKRGAGRLSDNQSGTGHQRAAAARIRAPERSARHSRRQQGFDWRQVFHRHQQQKATVRRPQLSQGRDPCD